MLTICSQALAGARQEMTQPTPSHLRNCSPALTKQPGIVRSSSEPRCYTYEVLNTYPHDTGAFTQGLIYEDTDVLYESTGLYGSSSLRRVDLQTGDLLMYRSVPQEYFAEGMTIFKGKIYQLTWQSLVGFIYDRDSFELTGQFSYEGEGWGLTHDDDYLIMSDGTNVISFRDPDDFSVVKTISVYNAQGEPVNWLNELEYISGEIYANIWQSDWIVRIDPSSGAITGWIDLQGLLPPGTPADVLNGIAYDQTGDRLFVTGKFWPYVFEIRLVEVE